MKTPYITAILALGERIKGANNGYLFAPTEAEIKLAKDNPNIFTYTYNSSNEFFPHKIELK